MRRDTSAVFSGYRDSCFDSNFFDEHPPTLSYGSRSVESQNTWAECFFPVRKRLGIQFAAYEVDNKNFEIHLVQLKHIDLTWGQAQYKKTLDILSYSPFPPEL